MHKLATALLAVSCLGACAAGPATGDKPITLGLNSTTESIEAQREMLIGKWFLNQRTAQGGVEQEIAELNSDGSFTFYVKSVDAGGGVEKSVETGEWGIVGDVHFTITKTGGKKYYDVYKVLKLDEREFVYRHSVTGNEYRSRRVGPDFRLPD
jgi:hypothetical protein